MKKFYIRVWCMTASYELPVIYAENLDDAKRIARSKVMPDQRGWTFSEYTPDEEQL